MIKHWIATFEYAGNLKTLLPEVTDARIVDYTQIRSGYIRVSMLCDKSSLIKIAIAIIGDCCGSFHVEPVITLYDGAIFSPEQYKGKSISTL